MSENKRPVRTAAPTKKPAAARPAPARTSSPQQRSANAVRTNAARRPAQKRGNVRRKKKQRFSKDELVVLGVIALLLVLIIAGLIWGISSCNSSKDKRVVNVSANIHPEETPVPQSNENTQKASSNTEIENTASSPAASSAIVPTSTVTAVKNNTSGGLRSCHIRTVGDFVIDSELIDSAREFGKTTTNPAKYDFSGMLSLIWDYMGDADWTVANVDGSMGDHYKYGFTGYPQFNTPSDLMYALKDSGVDMLTLANNHMLDGWFDGLNYEIQNVEAKGLDHIGASSTQEERDTPKIVEINGIKVGFLNYTESLNSMESRGVDQKALDFGAHWIRNSDCALDVRALKDAGADVVVCYMHWGTEYKTDPDNNQKFYANKLVKAGVDIIVGGHPHVVQHAEWLTGTNQYGETQKTLCIYSVGNFLSKHRLTNTDGGIIFDFTIQEKGDGSFEITNYSYIPTYVWITGNEITGTNYRIVPCGVYLNSNTRPQGMSDKDYASMKQSYENQVKIMDEGVGTLKTK
ncbi:MAG: CapA family protein [Clostridia bacterium]|nr:CapA family protein [Clostridia bacterium]